jgi:hypothetical protein
MWTSQIEELNGGRGLKVAIHDDATPLAYADVLDRWQHDADFRSYFVDLLKNAPYSAFRWETPSISKSTAMRPFEFVLLDSPGLATNSDPSAFAEHFGDSSQGDVVTFSNLGKDAIMVVPCPKGPSSAYGHVAAFVRQAPEPQIHRLWEMVGEVMARRLGKTPV